MEFNRRRLLIAISPFAALGAARLILRSSSTATAATYVEVIPFDDSGRPQPRQRLPRVDRTDAEWKSRLSAEQFYVTRRGTTDTPFTGTYYKLHDPGMFRCVCCGNAAFTSETKYDSGTGWPSFWDVAAPENITRHQDGGRVEVRCTLCDGHLGHVFDDGPEPTHLRYCINESALRFVPSR